MAFGRSRGSERRKSTAPITGSIPSCKRPIALLFHLVVKLGRQPSADPMLDGGYEILAG